MATPLSLYGIRKQYPGTDAPSVDNVNLKIPGGEFVSFLGPSGCGKTTTLRMIAGLIEPTAGTIRLGDEDITALPVHKRDMGMVFQSYALFPHLDVSENVAFGLQMRKVAKDQAARRVEAALDMVHLSHLKDRRIKQLSGGQQQRVALARALVIEPRVLLLDEPLSNLDAKLRETMRDEIRSIQQQVGITTVFVTHDQDEALATSDRIVVMSEGRVEQVGRPQDIYEHPANRFVATFIGRANLVEVDVLRSSGGRAEVEVPGIGRIEASDDHGTTGSASLMIRPHRVRVESAQASDAHGIITSAIYVGDQVEYTVQVGDVSYLVQVPTFTSRMLPVGSQVRLTWAIEDGVVLADAAAERTLAEAAAS